MKRNTAHFWGFFGQCSLLYYLFKNLIVSSITPHSKFQGCCAQNTTTDPYNSHFEISILFLLVQNFLSSLSMNGRIQKRIYILLRSLLFFLASPTQNLFIFFSFQSCSSSFITLLNQTKPISSSFSIFGKHVYTLLQHSHGL